MATNTGGGTTSSFMNTPQAVDDYFCVLEDGIYSFDVMANDLGGNAKILWSIDDTNLDGTYGVANSGDGTYDLLKQDVAGVPELSDLGARIWIEAGKIKYDATVFNYLALGQTATDRFTYAIRMSNGTLSWATVTITITGTNDGPDIKLVGSDTASASIAETNSGLSANGTLTVFDPDTADSVNVSVSSVGVGGTGGTGGLTNAQLLAMLSLTGNNANAADGTQGSLGWGFNSGSQAFDYLAVGQTLVLTYTLTGTDGNGGTDTQLVTITITGTNDGPTANADTASTDEDSSVLINVLANDTDPDTSDTLVVTAAAVTTGLGAATIESGQVRYDPGSAYNYLAVGESETVVITYSISDGNGGTSTSTATVTVTGTNDGPTANADTASTDEDSSVLINVLANDTDPDTSDTLVVTAAAVTTGLGAATIESGQVRYDPGSAYNYLAVGESETVVITYSISDGNGGTSTSTATVTVTGTNDGPTANADTASTDEDSSVLINVLANDTDPDTSDTLVVTAAAVTTGLGAATIESGQVRYDPGSAYNYLAVGESETVVITYSISDGNGGTSTSTATVTVTGTNDGPTANADTASTDEDSSVLINVLANDTDPDTSDTLVVTAAAVTTGLGAATIESGQVRYDPGSAYNYLAVGESETVVITYSISDGNGGTSTSTATVTVTGTNDGPTANADTASTDEDSSVLINVLANDTDPDTSDTLVVTAAAVTTGLGAATIESGQVRYDPGSAYNYLAVGESETVVITYSISDGNGGTSTSTATVTVTGTNDGPTANADTASTDEDSSVLINVLANDTDPDTSDTLVVTAAAVTTGLGAATIESGQVRYDPGSAYNYLAVGESETVVITYSISDGNGGTSTSTATVTVTGTNDGPTANADTASTDEDSSVLINVLANDTDPDTSDTLVVTAAAVTTGLGAATIESGQVRYDPGSAYNYLAVGESETVVITYSISDGNGGTSTSTATVTVTGTNDAPVLTGDLAATVSEGGTYQLTTADVNFTDPDDGAADVTFTATGLSNGTLYVNGIAQNTFTGTQLAAGLVTFTHDGSETITAGFSISVEDGNEDSSAPVAQLFNFTVSPVNDAPVNTVPDGQAVDEDQTLVFSNGNGNAISINDADAGSNTVQVALSVASGTLTLGSLLGLTVTGGANGSSTVTVQGTQAAINAGLQGLTYQGNLNFNGGDSLSIVTSDLGNSGSGGPLMDTDSVAITVNAVNDAPVIDVNGANTYTLSGPAVVIDSSIPITDVDSTQLNGATIQITGGRQAGDTLNFINQNGITGSYNSSTGLLTLSGVATLANYQTALQSITFSSTSTSTTQRTVTFQVTDTGNASSATDTAVVNVAGDTTPPTIVSEVITSATGAQNNFLNAGDFVSVTVTMSEVVNVTGTPQLALNIGGTTVQANYSSGSGTNTLVFTYTIIGGQNDANGISINANGLTLNGGTIRDAANNNATLTAGVVADNPNFKVDTALPTVTITAPPVANGIGNTTTVTFQFSEVVTGFTVADISSNRGTFSNFIQVDGDTYTATLTRTANGSINATVATNSYSDLAGNLGPGGTSNNFPAGVSGDPINLGLNSPISDEVVTVILDNVPDGWVLNGGSENADGTWTIQTLDVGALTITTPSDFAGAAVLNVSLTWTNTDGSIGSVGQLTNVEAFAAGNPIFAWSGDDTLTGSASADLFVFSQPIGADTVHNFDAAADRIDLIGYGVSDYGGLAISDTAGGALVDLGNGQTILLDGVSMSSLTVANFLFDVSPTVTNSGTMTIGDGAMLPLSGTILNSGTISLLGNGAPTVLELIQYGITLRGGGNLVLSDSSSNVISGTLPTVTFTNVDNVISGAGQLGGGSLTLINGGTIIADGGSALIIDTGANAVTNSGTIEATGLGGLEIVGSIANSGTLLADGSSILVGGNLTGGGDVLLNGISSVEFGAGANNDVKLDDGASGLIVFDDADAFSGSISGLDFNDQIDLRDVTFDAGTTMSYTDNGNGSGVLTITDSSHSVQLVLVGDYRIEDFILGSNGQGGSLLTNNVGDLLFP